MSDRITAYLVTLDEPIREDDAEITLDEPIREDDAEITLAAIRQIRGIAAVKPVTREMLAEQAAITRRDIAWQRALSKFLRSAPKDIGEPS